MYAVSFDCGKCGHEFDAEWTFGDNVVCTNCRTVWETDYETNTDDDIQGPWVTVPAKQGRG